MRRGQRIFRPDNKDDRHTYYAWFVANPEWYIGGFMEDNSPTAQVNSLMSLLSGSKVNALVPIF